MALRINEYCIACGWCQPECKNGAIKEGDNMQYAIDPGRCTECVGWYEEPRCVEVCFLSAPEPDPAHKESHEQLLAKWRKLHPRKTPQVA
jgi:ferredoxin